MTTSGTVGTTKITTIKLIEHAVRRCSLSASSIGAEQISIAEDNLYLILLALANKGLNLWCVETNLVGLKAGQATYSMPDGTIDVLSLVLSRPTRIEGTNTQLATSYTTSLANEAQVLRAGVKFDAVTASDTVVVSYSDDGITFTAAQTVTRTDWKADTWYWFALDPIVTARYVRISTNSAMTVSEFYLASSVYDYEISRFNRDEYMALPNKQIQSASPTNYYYERKVNPQVTLWAVPNDDDCHLTLVRHRQIQDVGILSQEIELPERWKEAIIWQLAERLCFELPGVDPNRIPMILAQAQRYLSEVEVEETDGANIRFAVQIGGYTR